MAATINYKEIACSLRYCVNIKLVLYVSKYGCYIKAPMSQEIYL